MKRYVLDTHALIAYSEREKGAQEVADLLKKALAGSAEIYLCRINWGEMYYIALREGGEERAESYRTTIAKYPVRIVEIDEELTLQAARFKAFHKMSFADGFAAALAKQKKAELVTGDKDFKPLEGEIKMLWI